eukprot:CAMPEP_0194201468 /NCGR_PEP_ID=MMETSP0156-20130528/1724_1 /TAXON_ID=33649 /ORGANISM="Thalassionema nitzschioides, Strain L26-B" /LENGTH=1030 /DNA_ID=CAMNT_0038926659 /DNA_START=107 /DNA_END=3196 /DNA_ORIENTATION=-
MEQLSLLLGDTSEEHSRLFLLLPFGSKSHILAYGGEDGSVSLIDESSVKTARRFTETIRSIAVSHDGTRVAVGFGDGSVTIFVYDKLEGNVHPFLAALRKSEGSDDIFSQIEGMEETSNDEVSFPGPRFQTPVRALAFDRRENNLLACGSEDSGFCIVDTTSSELLSKKRFLVEQSAEEHNETGVRGLSYYFNGTKALLASLDLQGRLCVWDVTGSDPELDYELLHKDEHKSILKVDQGVVNDSEPADQASFPVWGNSLLGLPGSNDVQLRKVGAIDKQQFISSLDNNRGHIEPIVSLSFNEMCDTLVTAGRDGRICSWKIKIEESNITGEFLKIAADLDDVCTNIMWTGSKIYFAFSNGTFSCVDALGGIIPKIDKHKDSSETAGDIEEKNGNETNSVLSDDEDVNFGDESSSKPKQPFVDDEADSVAEADVESMNDPQPVPEPTLEENSDSEDEKFGGSEVENLENFDARKNSVPIMNEVKPQAPFAPSSTPLDLTRRIMCWNHVGTITSHRNDEVTIRNTIDVVFTDAAFRRPITFTDNMDFIIGSMGDDGAFFATDIERENDAGIEDDIDEVVEGLNISDTTKAALRNQKKRMKTDSGKASGSSLYFHRFETFGNLNNKDWVITLPDGELAVGCACGEGWSACITNRRFLRIFSSGGNQGPVVWLDGEPVTIVGRLNSIAVFYHDNLPLSDGTQKLAYKIYDGISIEEIASGSLSCISSRSSLSWAGFSKEGSLMVMDSDGMLSILGVAKTKNDNSFSWNWSPILDTVGLRKSVDDTFWPITVQDGKLICVPLKGGNNFPDATRRPVTTALNLRMPLANGSDKNSILEELALRAKLALNQKKYMLDSTAANGYDVSDLDVEYTGLCAQVDKVTLKLYMANVETGKLERALDLVHRLHLEKSFAIAMTIADRTNHRNLSDKIEDIKDSRFLVEAEKLDDNIYSEDERYDQSTPSQQSRNISPDTTEKLGMKRQREVVESNEGKSNRQKINPFAKKRFESPARPSFSPQKETPSRLVGISRLSSFSAK